MPLGTNQVSLFAVGASRQNSRRDGLTVVYLLACLATGSFGAPYWLLPHLDCTAASYAVRQNWNGKKIRLKNSCSRLDRGRHRSRRANIALLPYLERSTVNPTGSIYVLSLTARRSLIWATACGCASIFFAANLLAQNALTRPNSWREAIERQDWPTALRQIKPQAEAGNVDAQSDLGMMYRDGIGVTQDYAQAIRWLSQASRQGFAVAQTNLAVMYYHGLGVQQDHAQAAAWYRKAAVGGNAIAQGSLGDMYFKGYGVALDFDRAATWYRKAADQDVAAAQSSLASMYHNGQGVAKDVAQACAWYRRAAVQGYAHAQSSLGDCHYHGRSVAQDYIQAATWYRFAAAQGDANAQNNLGVIYGYGQGVPKNLVVAYALYSLSAAGAGNGSSALTNRKSVATAMTVSEIEQGEMLARKLAKPNRFLAELGAADQFGRR